ncbi:hypothetical protein [Duganella radicis]|uniref:Uncharacterized protein n=1 Tax=Duganella radicis TaxID=551988 RepID=A0A6L6PQ84_9BURK|nr:hypothetical protein [Duganella radicis]MTV40811.1 hypothetical protein [Duganella radicis]
MSTLLQSRKILGFCVIALAVAGGYALLKHEPEPVTPNSPGAEPRNLSGSATTAGNGIFAWGAVAPRAGSYAALDPKDFALKEGDYGGHPAYSKAMQYLVCADYVESKKDIERDYAEQAQSDPSGNTLRFAQWQIAMKEEQCKNVSKASPQQIAELMREAAKAGDVRAQSYLLNQDASRLIDAARADADAHPNQEHVITAEEKGLLSSATTLAETGDREAIFLAAKLTATNRFGQQDLTASAAWALTGMQQNGRPFSFSANDHVFETEPYSTLSVEQRQAAVQKAQENFARCCSRR